MEIKILKKKARIIKFIRYCSGVKNQAWYLTNVGIRRKPIQKLGTGIPATELKPLSKPNMETLENPIKISWFKRIFKFKWIWKYMPYWLMRYLSSIRRYIYDKTGK